MSSGYQHLNSHDRVTIMLMNRQGSSARCIARTLQRASSTISRELHRGVMAERIFKRRSPQLWDGG